ncbi:MAG: polyprenyl synthetase family protein [Verrucomicrobiota bacterium]
MSNSSIVSGLAGLNPLSPFEFLRPELDRVESRIRAQAEDFDPAVEPFVGYILNTSGKRIRPALTFLSGGATGGVSDDHHKLATILELIHVATLVHDDIIDGAEIRRQAPTANAKWGNALSVLLGDCLFSHALMLSTEFEDKIIGRRVAQSANEVCTGEIQQTQRRFDMQLSREEYFEIISKKTAALFASAMELGAKLNRQDDETCGQLKQFGNRIGTAYQIYDDCIDLIGDESEFGKTLRTDINRGKLTLPILNLLESSDEPQQEKLHRMLLQTETEPIDLGELASLSGYRASITQAIDTGQEMIAGARADLGCLEESEHAGALLGITDFLHQLFENCRE